MLTEPSGAEAAWRTGDGPARGSPFYNATRESEGDAMDRRTGTPTAAMGVLESAKETNK